MNRPSRPITERAARSVGSYASTEPIALPQLYDPLDPDALGTVVRSMRDEAIQSRIAGHTVTVHRDGGAVEDEAGVVTDGSGRGPGRRHPPIDD